MSNKELKESKSINETNSHKGSHKAANELVGAVIIIFVLLIVFALFSLFGNDEQKEISGSKTMNDGVVACGFYGAFDGYTHGVTVKLTGEASGAQVSFGEKAGKCNKSKLGYKNVGKHKLYYEVKKYGYKTVKGSADVVIMPCILDDSNLVLRKTNKFSYDGDMHKISYSVIANGMLLTEGEDYELSAVSDSQQQSKSGEYSLVIRGKGNYAGNAEQLWSIVNGKLTEYRIQDYRAEYDGAYHSAEITFPAGSDASVTYGTKADSLTLTEPLSFKDIGVHTCMAKISRAGYEDIIVNELVIISEKEAMIYIDDVTKNKGEEDPEYTYKVVGLCSGEELKGISLSRNQGEEIGVYNITAREIQPGLSNPNYTIGVSNGKLTIAQFGSSKESSLMDLIHNSAFIIIVCVITAAAVAWAVYMLMRKVRR